MNFFDCKMLPIILLTCCLIVASTEQMSPKIQPIVVPSNIKTGSTLVINCVIESGEPPFYIDWVKDNQTIDVKLYKVEDNFSTLLIKPTKSEHSGNYHCRAKNKHGSDFFAFHISINGEFQIKLYVL